ncbi:sushi, von Willebrand factor type A, EGF and pentraxin domain-containing protein 1-like isoform X2 [Ischnura elegans]|uniref:sushi, von Willebrand factor type A, EGF and pentraxin domain-containing protein 1-like isoform X2 n=1 Tax=Ischnura elegans TaxID=197161 RepID=UPI001ED8A5D3|nr:sushi, von Willebrand factor type A, EGF and pentraxin domain-containing protein 1-like isoform X2 [Ischnura elegans]
MTSRCGFVVLHVLFILSVLLHCGYSSPMPKSEQQLKATNVTEPSMSILQDEKLVKNPTARENIPVKSRADVLGGTLRRLLRKLKEGEDPRLELVFLVDSSASVGAENFFNEIRFVRKLLSDFTVSSNAVRVALVTFSSRNRVIRHIDHLSPQSSRQRNHKCSLMQEEFPRITYTGGGTYTLGAMLEAEAILRHARRGVRRAVFLITDGYSNGGDPRPVAQRLKATRSTRGSRRNLEGGDDNKEEGSGGRKSDRSSQSNVEIFTFGIKNGNTEELLAMATDREHTFIVGSFREFEALGRRAFHQDLQIGSFLPVNSTMCNNLCTIGNISINDEDPQKKQCCDMMGECACGTISGHYSCICPPGHYGTGLRNDCHPCPLGTYNPGGFPGDMHLLCRRCPDPSHTTVKVGAVSVNECICGEGYIASDEKPSKCTAITCPPLSPPVNGYFTRMISGKRSAGRRQGGVNRNKKNGLRRIQSGSRDQCPNLTFKSTCGVRCKSGYTLIGSHVRVCGPNGHWTGHDASCVIKKCPALQQPRDGIVQCEQKLSSRRDNSSLLLGPKDGFLPNTICQFDCNPGYHLVGSAKRTCLPNGIWDGLQVYCKAKSCPSLPSLPHGKVFPPTCIGRQHHSVIITSCLLVCDPGYVLWGVRDRLEWETNQGKLVCGPDGNWELTNPEIASTKEALAWRQGKWSGGRCVDIEAPTLHCPNNISVVTDMDKKYATVHWDQPTAIDNSGIPVTLTVIPAISWPAKFPLGANDVTIVARDANRNKAKCKFTITVKDMQPPTVHACESPPVFILPSEPATSMEPKSEKPVMAHGLTWDRPVFEDNSGDDVRVQVKAIVPGKPEATVWEGLDGGQGEVFPIGETAVHYTAFDRYGNNKSCEITITVKDHACPELSGPINGNSNCSKGRKKDTTSYLCTLTCSEGYAFPVSTPQEYFCSDHEDLAQRNSVSAGYLDTEGSTVHNLQYQDAMNFHKNVNSEVIHWEPRELLPFADCMVAAIPNTLQQDGLIFMDGDNSICSDSVSFQQVEDTIRKEISQKLAEICGTGSTGLQCEIIGDLEKVCDNFVPESGIGGHLIPSSSSLANGVTNEGKERDGQQARKGRRSGSGKGARKRKLRDKVRVKGKRGGTKEEGKGGEARRAGGRRREQQGSRRGGKQRKMKEFGKGRNGTEGEARRAKKPAGPKETSEIKHQSNRTRRSVEEYPSEDSSEGSKVDKEESEDEYDYEVSEESEESDRKSPGVGVYFKMVGKLGNGTHGNQTNNEATMRAIMEKVQLSIQEAVNRGDFDIKVQISNVSTKGESTASFKELRSRVGFEEPQKACDNGSVMVNNICVKCPPGTHHDEFEEECVICKKGTYQPLEGQSFCHQCPEGYSTNFGSRNKIRRKATSITDCIAECDPGTYSVDGLLPCTTCPKGYFASHRGSLNCSKCPENTTTISRGAIGKNLCQDICLAGTISESGVQPCYLCPAGYFQHNTGKTFCMKHEEGDEESAGVILPFNGCLTLPCLNGATCIPLSTPGYYCSCPDGYTGTFCELQDDACLTEPCLNGGLCSSNGTSYLCSCSQDFTGLNCEIISDPCSSSPCKNNGICMTYGTSFECSCTAEFEGIQCERMVCLSPPCTLNDSCILNGDEWECICGNDSAEDECTDEEVNLLEEKISSEYEELQDIKPNSVLHFPKPSTTNYILVTGDMERNYAKVTLCGWINTRDQSNYGTVFSLATENTPNALVLTDYSGFVIYVGGNSTVTDVSANDGNWHHFCLSWSSQGGNWQIFLDGNVAAHGENLSPGYTISGQVTIVIGQEQDWAGGGFSETESFVGRMAMLTIENNIITAEEAFQRASLCRSGNKKFLIWDWADFLTEIHGRIEIESSNLCQRCNIPSSPKNGKVVNLNEGTYSDDDGSNGGLIIRYSCEPGFTITKGPEIRRCLSNGTWDGKQPSCKRNSCDVMNLDFLHGINQTVDTALQMKCKGRKKAEFKEGKDVEVKNYSNHHHSRTRDEKLTDPGASSSNNKMEIISGKDVNQSSAASEEGVDFNSENLMKLNEEDPRNSEMKCKGPLGSGKLNDKWTSYSEAHNLQEVLGSNNHKQFLFDAGTVLHVSCDNGFELIGVSYMVCGIDGYWRKDSKYLESKLNSSTFNIADEVEEGKPVAVPSCKPVKCSSPPDIHHGEWELMERKRWNKGEGLKWRRLGEDLGYEEISNRINISEPCTNSCSNQQDKPINKEEEFKFGDIAEYDCEYGYALVGPQSLHCSVDGSWVWSNRYSKWPGLEYAPQYYPPHKWPFNNENPHAQEGTSKAPRPPVCLPVRCPTPPPPLNGGFVHKKEKSHPRAINASLDHSEAYYVGDEVLNTCNDEDNRENNSHKRRQLVGPRLRRCLPSGQWSSYRPTCRDL